MISCEKIHSNFEASMILKVDLATFCGQSFSLVVRFMVRSIAAMPVDAKSNASDWGCNKSDSDFTPCNLQGSVNGSHIWGDQRSSTSMMKFGSRCHISGPLIYNLKFVIKTDSSIGAILVLAISRALFTPKKGRQSFNLFCWSIFWGWDLTCFPEKKHGHAWQPVVGFAKL